MIFADYLFLSLSFISFSPYHTHFRDLAIILLGVVILYDDYKAVETDTVIVVLAII